MTVLAANALTLTDMLKRLDPKGGVAVVIELLSQLNEICDDAMFLEANGATKHRTTMRTGLPTAAWRQLNQGTQPSKSTTVQVDDTIGMMEAWSEIDEKLVNMNKEPERFRLSEAMAFLEAMVQTLAGVLMYGDDSVTKEKFLGFMPRFSSLSAANGGNIIDAGGSDVADSASILLVGWGDLSCHMIYPQGSTAGLKHEPLGVETVETTAGVAGSRMRAYRDKYSWDVGLSVRDWRYVVRIANIDVSALVAESGNADLPKCMLKALARLPNRGMCRPVFYCNRTVRTYLDIQALGKASSQLTLENFDGKRVTAFQGVPIRTVDAMLNTEARVT
jgi:hypothetical protein